MVCAMAQGPVFSVYTIITYKLITNSDQLQDTIFKVYTALESQKRRQHHQADILEAAILHSKPWLIHALLKEH